MKIFKSVQKIVFVSYGAKHINRINLQILLICYRVLKIYDYNKEYTFIRMLECWEVKGNQLGKVL